MTLADLQLAPQMRAQPHGVRPRRLVFLDAEPWREHADPHGPTFLMLPGPYAYEILVLRRPGERVHVGGGGKLDVLEGRRPLGPPGDVGELTVRAVRDLARGRAQHRDLEPLPCQQPRRPDERVPGERQLGRRREDA